MRDAYQGIMAVLTEPLTAKEIGKKLNHNRGSYKTLLKDLYDVGAISRKKVPPYGRIYEYTRIEATITLAEVKKRLGKIVAASKVPPPPGSRVVSFDDPGLQQRLRESDRLHKRKPGKVHVGASWNYDI